MQYSFSLKCAFGWALLCITFAALPTLSAWSSNPNTFQTTGGRRKHQPTNPPPNDLHVVRDPLITSHNMLRESGFSSFNQNQESTSSRKKSIKFSHSKMLHPEAFSAVPVAHGMLSPQTVMRLEELTRLHRHHSPALDSFLDSYYSKGPMSCVPMLSDPDVLPHLTMAMRYVTA
jgi:hypothetical protein